MHNFDNTGPKLPLFHVTSIIQFYNKSAKLAIFQKKKNQIFSKNYNLFKLLLQFSLRVQGMNRQNSVSFFFQIKLNSKNTQLLGFA